jgi:triosephosphate isomerase
MRKKILAANWKMNLTQPQVLDWLKVFHDLDWHQPQQELRIYPSSIYLKELVSTGLHVGAQNVFAEQKGAFTGEIAVEQLQSIDVQSVLIGHSERRLIFKEDDALIAQKVRACTGKGFPFILCCGEAIEQREQGQHLAHVESQLKSALEQFDPAQHSLLTIAYEPIWAIGSGMSARTDQISEMHAFIRDFLEKELGAIAHQIPILYGGSVNSQNASELFSCPSVDGALVGGSSLDPQHFHQLWQALSA